MQGCQIRLKLAEVNSKWDLADFVQPQNRLDVVVRYNSIFGVPCEAVKDMQMDFICGRMEPWQIISFVQVCRAYIAAARKIACNDPATVITQSTEAPPAQDDDQFS